MEEQTSSREMPILPMRDTVLFPGSMAPLTIGRTSSLKMLEENLPKGNLIGAFLQKDSSEEFPHPHDLHPVGCLARVLKMMRQDENTALVLVQGVERIRASHYTQTTPYLRAQVETLPETTPDQKDEYWTAAYRNLRDSAIQLVKLTPSIPDEAINALQNIEDGGGLTDFLCWNLSLDLHVRQELLEETNVVKRLEKLQQNINNQLHIAELQEKLRSDVATEFSDAQKRAYLREQLRAIQRELGEEGGLDEEVDTLRQRLEEAGLNEKAMETAERELKRLEIIPPASPDHSVIVSYLETMAELPWNEFSEDSLDLKQAQKQLDKDHYGLDKVKRRLIEFLAVRKLNPNGHGPILCFVGPPGVGKTSLGQSIADSMGRKFARIALGGIRDESEIRGHRRTYIGSMPGRLIQELRRLGTRNPVIMLDEVDKLGSDFRGDPASALLEVLDPRQNHEFSDRYLDVPFDLSQVLFIATANTLDTIPAPLLDRMEVIRIAGYTEEEKLHIAYQYLVKRQLEENGLKPEQCRFTEEALRLLISDYTREAGVRNLEREIGSVCRAVGAKVAKGESEGEVITEASVQDILGPSRFVRETKLANASPGVVTGLAYTPVGGDVLHVEAIRYPGKGNVKLTGQLGDVMKESVQAAYSLVHSRAKQLGIDPKDFNNYDVHVHVPAGAIPKDGPSAGVTMFTALASLYTNKPVDNEVAMTGEITLRGEVLPIGGLKEKSIAALRAGVKTVLFPKLNEKDLPDLPDEVKERITLIPVENVDQVLEHAIAKPAKGWLKGKKKR